MSTGNEGLESSAGMFGVGSWGWADRGGDEVRVPVVDVAEDPGLVEGSEWI